MTMTSVETPPELFEPVDPMAQQGMDPATQEHLDYLSRLPRDVDLTTQYIAVPPSKLGKSLGAEPGFARLGGELDTLTPPDPIALGPVTPAS